MTTHVFATSTSAPGVAPPGSFRFLAVVCLVASIGGLLFGFDTAVISGTEQAVARQYKLDALMEGLFAASALIGCIAGAVVAGLLGDRLGRKKLLVVAAWFFFLSAIGCAVAPEFWSLLGARIAAGLGIGMASVLAPMYISEFSPPHLRGRLVATFQLSIVIGILAAYFSNWLLAWFAKEHSAALAEGGLLHWIFIAQVWRAMLLAGVLPAGAFLVLLLLVPESPRWLARAGRTDEALRVFRKVCAPDDAKRQVEAVCSEMIQEDASWRELFKPGLRTALLVGVLLSVFGQLSGVNIVVYYGPKILAAAGFEDMASLFGAVGIGLINLVFTVIAMTVIDRWGRRPLLIRGMAAVTVALAAIATLFLVGVRATMEGTEIRIESVNQTAAIGIAAMIGVYMACEALSICAVIWVLTPEIFPNRVRARAASIATFANWGTNTLSVFLFPWYVARFGMHVGFFTFAAICLVATIFYWRCVPETKGKSLEEIERHWTP